MLLYTYQTKEAYARLQQEGVLRITAENAHLTLPQREAAWATGGEKAYRYMMHRMRLALGEPPEGVVSPIWAFYKWENRRGGTPLQDADYRGQLRITFRVDRRLVLLSDFDLFTVYVLGDWFLPIDAKESAAMEGAETAPQLYALCKEISWDRIFCTNWQDDYVLGKNSGKSIQATLWELRREQVVDTVPV